MTLPAAKEDAGRLSKLLAVELESARTLLHILEQEHQALVNGESEEISAISEQKQTHIKSFGEQLLLRDRFLTGHQLPTGSAGTDLFVEQVPADSELALRWRQMQELAVRLNDCNEINGGIVALAQRHVRQALNILTCHTEQNSTYGPAGQQMGRSPQSLAKA
ncbi:MAG: flagellar protein FlgN [Gammaproteobacteria bacterium]|nr:flagellar protein FlgN [Gammaproteobacteria bacterium]